MAPHQEGLRMKGSTFREVMEILLREYPPEDWSKGMDPFEVLVSVVVSQNTAVANERRALERLRERVGITPQTIARAPLEVLEEALRPAGLHRSRAPRLKEIARRLLEGHGGDLKRILELPQEQAREALMDIPGVGPKTADVVLSMVVNHLTLPIDTHIWRIANRWEVYQGRDYEKAREALEAIIPPERRRDAHLSLIRFGRTTCLARRPLCTSCPVQGYCPYFQGLNLRV
ncbi:MAG: endonuclease III domain-containing protein [Thermoplasmata archaeon]